MSETWPPSNGPEDTDRAEPTGADNSRDNTNPAIPLGPAKPAYWREYPYAGAPDQGVVPDPGADRQPQPFYPGAQYLTDENPTVPGGPPPPPPGGTTPGAAPGGGWSAGPTGPMGPTPPYGGWAPPMGYAAPPPRAAKPAKRSVLVAALAAVFVLVAAFAGAGLGHLVWPSSTTSSAVSSPTTGSSGSSGGQTSPFGSGSSGSQTSPFGSGSSGSSGNASTGAGAPSDISAIAAKVDPGLVDINTNLSYQDEQAAGTGMVLTSSGEILTNNHVIDGATSISVTDAGNGKTYKAKVVGYDRTGDVAVISLIGASGLQTVSTDTGSASVGQAVVGVGNAGGTGGTPSAAGGSITAMDQSITASDDGGGNSENLTGLIQTDAGIQPGDSGGSLVNTSGQVLGMDTAASEDSSFQSSGSQGYAIPIGTALSIAQQIEAGDASSTVHIGATGFLGVSVQSSNSTGSIGGSGGFGGGSSGGSGSSSTTSGASVEGALSGSPAAKAGLVKGDVITGIDGKTVSTSSDLSNLLEQDHPGDVVQLQWTNTSGQTQSASVTLESGPPA